MHPSNHQFRVDDIRTDGAGWQDEGQAQPRPTSFENVHNRFASNGRPHLSIQSPLLVIQDDKWKGHDEEKADLLGLGQKRGCFLFACLPYVPRRYVLAILGFLGFINVYALRAILSVAVVNMEKEFNYSGSEKGLLLASFFIGYIFPQVPAGWLASRLGAKWVLGGGMFISGIFTLLLPIAAEIHLGLAVATRIVVGLGEGVCFPSMHAMLSKWAPPHERSRIGSLVYSGCYLGTVIAFPASTALADSALGWASIFYVFGGATIAWVLLWLVVVSSSPADHPSISAEERKYIIDSLPPPSSLSFRDIPWMKVALCLPFWALLINHTAGNWAFYTLLTWLPTYMKEVLDFDVHKAGFIAVLPYLALTVVVIVSGFVADLFIERKWLSTTAVRKIWQALGFTIAGGGLVAVGFANSVPLAVALMTIAGGAVGFTNSGFQVNHLDIAPNYAGILMGMTNCVATIPGIVSPYLTGIILGDDQHDIERWRIVFFISAGVYSFGLVIWLLFASGKKQF